MKCHLSQEVKLDQYKPAAGCKNLPVLALLSKEGRNMDSITPGDRLKPFLSQLHSRELMIMKRRIMSGNRTSLSELGKEMGVTRERIRQIEAKVLSKLNKEGLGDLIRKEVRYQLSAIDKRSFALKKDEAEKLLISNLGLSQHEFSLGGIAQFSRVLEVDENFLYFPTKQDLIEDLEDLYVSQNSNSAITISEFESARLENKACLRLSAQDFTELQLSLGWSHHSIYTYPPKAKSFEEKFFLYLSGENKEINVDSALSNHFPTFSKVSCLNRIRVDDRFILQDGGIVKIREEGDLGARTITDLISEALEGRDSITLEDLTKFVLERRAAAENSVRAYASTFPFHVKAGIVTRREAPRPPQVQVAKTKRLYQIHDGWRLRLPLNQELMRGSSAQLPSAIVGPLDLPVDKKKEYWSDQLDQMVWVSWKGMQPMIQAVRKVAQQLGGNHLDNLLIDFNTSNNTIHYKLVKFPIQRKGILGLADLMGVSDEIDAGPVISKLLMSSSSGNLSILETLELRKEYDAIDIYEGP